MRGHSTAPHLRVGSTRKTDKTTNATGERGSYHVQAISSVSGAHDSDLKNLILPYANSFPVL